MERVQPRGEYFNHRFSLTGGGAWSRFGFISEELPSSLKLAQNGLYGVVESARKIKITDLQCKCKIARFLAELSVSVVIVFDIHSYFIICSII